MRARSGNLGKWKLFGYWLVVAGCSVAASLVVYAQTSCPAPPPAQIDYLGALSGCRPGGAPCVFGERIDFFPRPVKGGSYAACESFFWTFGDGGNAGNQYPSHTYLSVGNFSVGVGISNGAGQSTAATARVIVVATAPPTVDEFSVVPLRVMAGQDVMLTWRTRLAHRIKIDPLNYEDTRPTGSVRVVPSQTTSYQLTAYGDANIATGGPVKVEVVVQQRRRAARH